MKRNWNNLIGEKIGYLEIVEKISGEGSKSVYKCLCHNCGSYCFRVGKVLFSNKKRKYPLNCGCISKVETVNNKHYKVGDIINGWELKNKEKEVYEKNKKIIFWKIKCTCGCNQEKIVRQSAINSTYCKTRTKIERENFLKNNNNIIETPNNIKNNLIGEKFGRLEVIGFNGVLMGKRYWVCKCDCGNIITKSEKDLKKDGYHSCGCYKKEIATQFKLDLVGKTFGWLTVIEELPAKDKSSYYLCECRCGNKTKVKGTVLNKGRIFSCGCANVSKGEQKIKNFLEENEIIFETQFKFPDCRNIKPLKFDFKIYYKETLKFFLCEYQGEQHYIPYSFSTKEKYTEDANEKFVELQLRDNIKKEYCKENNIKLIEIPYWDFNKIEEILSKELGLLKKGGN